MLNQNKMLEENLMKYKMNVDIEFWKSSTEEEMQGLFELLMTKVGMTEERANEYVEKIYYAVASEFGE